MRRVARLGIILKHHMTRAGNLDPLTVRDAGEHFLTGVNAEYVRLPTAQDQGRAANLTQKVPGLLRVVRLEVRVENGLVYPPRNPAVRALFEHPGEARLAVFFRGFGVAYFQKRPGRLPRIKPRRCLPQLGAYALHARGVNLRADVQDAQRQHPLGVTRGVVDGVETAHRVADQDELVELERLDKGFHIRDVGFPRVVAVRSPVGLAPPALVQGQDPIPVAHDCGPLIEPVAIGA